MNKLTEKQILSLLPSSQTDELVAEFVMNEPKPDPPSAKYDYIAAKLTDSPIMSPKRCWKVICPYTEEDVPYWQPISFSTDIASAWKIVDRFGQNRIRIGICQLEDDRFMTWVAGFPEKERAKFNRGFIPSIKSAPLAISLLGLVVSNLNADI